VRRELNTSYAYAVPKAVVRIGFIDRIPNEKIRNLVVS
jgi:hypothetical protein